MRVTIRHRAAEAGGAAGYYVVFKEGGRGMARWGPYATVREAKAVLAAMVKRHGGLRDIVDALEPSRLPKAGGRSQSAR